MPELPEIEIVKQSLYKNIKFKKIKKIIVKNRNLRFKLPSNFKNILKHKKIINISRFSKYIIIDLENSYFCISKTKTNCIVIKRIFFETKLFGIF